VDRQVPELRERREPEQQAERADHQTAHQQRGAVDALKVDARQIGQNEARLAAVRGGGRRRLRQQRPRCG
jgi:hypothetical protein